MTALLLSVPKPKALLLAASSFPENAQEKPQQGKVVAVGPGKLLDSGERGAIDLAEGDVVMFGKYGGTEITVDGQEVVILRESDILAKIG